MLIGLYSGRKIKQVKAEGKNITRTQSGTSAYNAIVKKYGEINDSSKYMHKGNGEWVKYVIANDKKKTGKVTTDLKKWREQPQKLDYMGKDTKAEGRKLSTGGLKTPSKPAGRTGKTHIQIARGIKMKSPEPEPKKERIEFESTYTGITDRIARRTKRQATIAREQSKGTYKNADTRMLEAAHKRRAKKVNKKYL
jgi:hypothetical protein